MASNPTKWRNRSRGFKSAGTVAARLIRTPLAKRGFATTDLITRWADVVGAAIAEIATPLQLSHAAKQGFGGTLIIGVVGARALEVQHHLPQIIERVNAHYGFRAVSRVSIRQIAADAFPKPVAKRVPTPISATAAQAIDATVAPLENEDLRAALARLGRAIAAREAET